MSTICCYIRVSQQKLHELQKHPETINQFIISQEEIVRNTNYTDTDKDWHALHFILTGSAQGGEPPLSNVILGGKPLGNIEYGYEIPRYLTAPEVNKTAQVLRDFPMSEFRERFNLEIFAKEKIYPEYWNSIDDEDEYLANLVGMFNYLVGFFMETSKKEQALIIYLS